MSDNVGFQNFPFSAKNLLGKKDTSACHNCERAINQLTSFVNGHSLHQRLCTIKGAISIQLSIACVI